MSEAIFPKFGDWEPTHQTLQWYSRGIVAVPRAHAESHPKWWHVSLKVADDGLVSDKSPLPDGRTLWLKMDLVQHKAILFVDDDPFQEISFKDGLTSSEFAARLLATAAELGLEGPYEREKYENEDKREYNPVEAGHFLSALVNADRIFKEHHSSLSGETSPVQLWPHGFDLAFEWFGTRVEIFDGVDYPSQLNLGFSLGDAATRPYFYSNPWPFERDLLLDKPLPPGASWYTEGWEGTILPYERLAGEKNAEERLLEYAKTVFNLTSPTLTAK